MDTNKPMHASELFVKCLENEGVDYIFGVPGEENLAFLEALRTSSIKLITTRHEQAAVFMASTIGRLTGKIGVALSTLGPGATNLVTGVAFAQLGGMPVLVITGQKPIRHSKQGRFQIIDTVRMMEPITKYSHTIESGERIPSMVREAIKIALDERPGAVHLELPEDIADEYVNNNINPVTITKIRRPGPDPKAIDAAVQMIENSKHPIIVIASGANRKLIRKQLKTLLDKTNIPFVTTQMGKGVEDEDSQLYIGTTALSNGDYVHQALIQSDLIIMIGHDISEKPPIILTPDTHKVIHINFSQSQIDDVYIPSLEVVGDISHTLWAISEKMQVKQSWDFRYFIHIKNALINNIKLRAQSTKFPTIPEVIVEDIQNIFPKDGILSLDNGMYKIWFARNFKAHEQNSILLDNALATMGAGLPNAIATKLVFPDKKVLVVAGDGGFMMNVSEIETAKRLGIDLTILILNDSAFGMIRWKQEDMGYPDFGLKFNNPDFVDLAKSFGVKGYKITSREDFKLTLNNTLNSKGIHIIDCPVDYSENNKALGYLLKEEINNI